MRAQVTWKGTPLEDLSHDELLRIARLMAVELDHYYRVVSVGFDRPRFTKMKVDPAIQHAYDEGFQRGLVVAHQKGGDKVE